MAKNADDLTRTAFGTSLKKARTNVGLTQADVAAAFGVEKNTVSAWETGRGVPDALMLRRLARKYETTADALLGNERPTTVAETVLYTQRAPTLEPRQRLVLRLLDDLPLDEQGQVVNELYERAAMRLGEQTLANGIDFAEFGFKPPAKGQGLRRGRRVEDRLLLQSEPETERKR